MTAKGKINASNVTTGDRIIVKARFDAEGHERITESATKTGEGVFIARVVGKTFRAAGQYEARGKYIIETTAGSFEAAPIQTMWLAPEDAAGVKRAHVEALAEDAHRPAAQEDESPEATPAAQEMDEPSATAQQAAEADETPAVPVLGADADAHLPVAGVPGTSLGEMRQAFKTDQPEELTLNSYAGKVDHMNSTETQTPIVRELTGSSVVRLLERVHARIRQNHPEVPEVVIVTGAGIGFGSGKWGHFRPQGWTTGETSIHEMFMAGETLAKGARQVLQTMIHESAHALAEHRGEKDTSRQGRWHNQVFRRTAEELGLEYKHEKADKTLGFSQVTLTAETVAEYKDLLDELDAEIHLMVRLPGWLGGTAGSDGEDGEDEGGENMGKAPKTGPATNSNNVKLTCGCEEPNIVRASKKVVAKFVVRCDDCEELFTEKY